MNKEISPYMKMTAEFNKIEKSYKRLSDEIMNLKPDKRHNYKGKMRTWNVKILGNVEQCRSYLDEYMLEVE